MNPITSEVKLSTVQIAKNGDWMVEERIIEEGGFLKTKSDIEYKNDYIKDILSFEINIEEY